MSIDENILKLLTTMAKSLEEMQAKLDRLAPEYELLSDAQAAARFNLASEKQATALRLDFDNGPRSAVDGKSPRASTAEWIAHFRRVERSKGTRQ